MNRLRPVRLHDGRDGWFHRWIDESTHLDSLSQNVTKGLIEFGDGKLEAVFIDKIQFMDRKASKEEDNVTQVV